MRLDDLEPLRAAVRGGRRMNACNRYGETLVHAACRAGSQRSLAYLLAHGGTLRCCDDAGRVPLHESCRAGQPCLAIALRILLEDSRQAHALDARGSAPLEYAPPEAWKAWYAFLHEHKQRLRGLVADHPSKAGKGRAGESPRSRSPPRPEAAPAPPRAAAPPGAANFAAAAALPPSPMPPPPPRPGRAPSPVLRSPPLESSGGSAPNSCPTRTRSMLDALSPMLPTVEAIAPQRALKHRGDGPGDRGAARRRDAAAKAYTSLSAHARSPDAGAARPGLRPAAFPDAPDESEPSSRNDDGDFSSDSDDDDAAAAPHVWSPRNPNPSPKPTQARPLNPPRSLYEQLDRPRPSAAVQSATRAAAANVARSAAADGAKPAFSPISPKKAIRKGFPQSGASLQPALPDHHSPPFAWASPGAGLRELDFTPSLRARGLDAPPEGDGEG